MGMLACWETHPLKCNSRSHGDLKWMLSKQRSEGWWVGVGR